MTLDNTCNDMDATIRGHYDLGPGDAVELFKAIWSKMVAGPNRRPLQAAIDLVSEAFTI